MNTKSIWSLAIAISISVSSVAGTFGQNRSARARRATTATSRRSATTTSEESKPKDDATKPANSASEPAAAPPATNKTQEFMVSVKEMPAGTTRGATLTLSDNSAIVDDKEPDIRVEALDPSSVTIDSQQLRADKKALLFTVKTADQAFGFTTLKILKGDEKSGSMQDQAYLELKITEFQAHPIPLKPTPSGIRRVDMMWTVLPDEVVKDNFGTKAAKNYYGIQVVIGNNTGFDLQIVSLGFKTDLKSSDDSDTIAKNAHADKSGAALPIVEKKSEPKFQIPVLDHRYVRGTIEKEQAFGGRARALSLITGFGTLSTGFLPFFHALGPRANFGSFTSLLNGNFKEGFGLAIPDLTIRQLNRLENQVMNDQLIIPNNTQERTVVFVPKGILSLTETVAAETNKKAKPTIAQIMTSLGELTLVGRRIEYLDMQEREVVVARSDGSSKDERQPNSNDRSTPPGPISITSVTPNSGTVSEAMEVSIIGSGFTSGADVKVKFGDRQVTGHAISATELKAIVPPVAAAGNIDVEVIAGNRSDTLKNGYTYMDELKIESFDPASVTIAGGATVRVKGKGFVIGAEVTVDGMAVENIVVSNDHNQITMTVPSHAAGIVTVVVKNPNGKSFSFANAIRYAQPASLPAPTPTPATTPAPAATSSPSPMR